MVAGPALRSCPAASCCSIALCPATPPHVAHSSAAYRSVAGLFHAASGYRGRSTRPGPLALGLLLPCAGSVVPGAHRAALQAGQLLAAHALQLGGLGVEALLEQLQPLPARVGVFAAARHIDVAALDRDGVLRGGSLLSKVRQQ